MQQFYEPPKVNKRRDIHEIFQQKQIPQSNPEVNQFIAFNQQRDKLGRLISRQQIKRNKNNKSYSKVELPNRIKHINFDITDVGVITDKAIQKIFKVRSVHNIHNSAQTQRLKLSAGISKMIRSPSVGQYDTAQINDKMKYKKPSQTQIRAHTDCLKQKQLLPTKLRSISTLSQFKQKVSKQSQKHRFIPKYKVELNPNLPQLQKFHTMRKLQMNISPNFEKSHLRFTNLIRESLILANKIKRDLQLD